MLFSQQVNSYNEDSFKENIESINSERNIQYCIQKKIMEVNFDLEVFCRKLTVMSKPTIEKESIEIKDNSATTTELPLNHNTSISNNNKSINQLSEIVTDEKNKIEIVAAGDIINDTDSPINTPQNSNDNLVIVTPNKQLEQQLPIKQEIELKADVIQKVLNFNKHKKEKAKVSQTPNLEYKSSDECKSPLSVLQSGYIKPKTKKKSVPNNCILDNTVRTGKLIIFLQSKKILCRYSI